MVSGINTLAFSLEMDWTLMWLTSKFLGHRTTYLRLTLAAIIGVLPTLWVLMQQNLYAVPWELELMWPIPMVWIGFPRLTRRFWARTYLLFLVMSFVAGGLMTAGLNWLAVWHPAWPVRDWMALVPPLLAAMGLWLPKQRVRQLVGRDSYGRIRMELDGRTLDVSTFWDSGNQLADPVLHRPVVIVHLSQVLEWIPRDILTWVTAVHQRPDPGLIPKEWQGRLGVVNFRTLTGVGQMPVIAVDRARGRYGDAWYPMVPLMVGLSLDPVASDRSYDALATPKSLLGYPHERVGA